MRTADRAENPFSAKRPVNLAHFRSFGAETLRRLTQREKNLRLVALLLQGKRPNGAQQLIRFAFALPNQRLIAGNAVPAGFTVCPERCVTPRLERSGWTFFSLAMTDA